MGSDWVITESVQWRYNWPMSAHASQVFSIAHCTDSEDLPAFLSNGGGIGDRSLLLGSEAKPQPLTLFSAITARF